MRIVTPSEAVAGIRSGDQIYLQAAAATPTELLDALVARAHELEDVKVVHIHAEGPGSAPGARDGGALPPPRAVHRSERATRGQRGPCRVHPGLPLGHPAPVHARPDSARRGFINVTPPDAHGFCSLGTSVDATLAAVRSAKTGHRPGQPGMPRTLGDSFVHVSRDRPRDRGRSAAVHVRGGRAGRDRAAHRRVRRRPHPRRRDAPDGHRRHPECRRSRAPRQAGPRRPHRDVHRCGRGPRRGRRHHRARARSWTAGKIVAAFMMGGQRLYDFVDDNPMVEMRAGRLHERHGRHPPIPAHVRRSTPRSRST